MPDFTRRADRRVPGYAAGDRDDMKCSSHSVIA